MPGFTRTARSASSRGGWRSRISARPAISRCRAWTAGCSITYNGEIYNFLLLRDELERAGVRFRSRSDTEVILALYARHGPDCLARLRGMFALAIWDRDGAHAVPGPGPAGEEAALLLPGRRPVRVRAPSRRPSSRIPRSPWRRTTSPSTTTSPTGTSPVRGRPSAACASSRPPTTCSSGTGRRACIDTGRCATPPSGATPSRR